jgi:hypothetical protein
MPLSLFRSLTPSLLCCVQEKKVKKDKKEKKAKKAKKEDTDSD